MMDLLFETIVKVGLACILVGMSWPLQAEKGWAIDGVGEFDGDGGHGSVVYTEGVIQCDYDRPGSWRFTYDEIHEAEPFDIFKYGVDVRMDHLEGAGDLFVSVLVGDEEGNTLHVLYAPLSPDFSVEGWQRVEGEFAVPRRGSSVRIQVRGEGPTVVSLREPTLQRTGSHRPAMEMDSRRPVRLENASVAVTVNPVNWSMEIEDRRIAKTWRTFPSDDQLVVLDVTTSEPHQQAVFDAIYLPANRPMQLTVDLDAELPEFSITTSIPDDTPMPSWAAMVDTVPSLYNPAAGFELVVPYGEGFLYPTDDPTIPHQLMAMGDGAGLTMPWFGAVDNTTGAAILCYTHDEDDVLTRLGYRETEAYSAGTMRLHWMSQMDQWGYDRTARFWLADEGGYVALARRYREDAKARGRVVTLKEKQEKLPQIERLLGAPNCWFNFIWHLETQEERMEALRWFRDQGMDRLILSNADALDDTDPVIDWGWLTSQYDLYIDVWPEDEADLAHVPGRTWGYPEGIKRLRTGEKKRGWVQRTEHGEFPSYHLCPSLHIEWARERIPASLQERTMLARLIDTTTALPLDQCFNPDHPMTRSDDKAHRIELLEYVRDQGLIVGSEMGVDWAAPVVSYIEGMLSPVAYRHPEAGYLMSGMEPTENTLNFQLNPAVRVPLWSLVYRDCAVAYWYWGDATNTFPELWPMRNAFNALYVTPPLYMILDDYEMYLEQRERIVETDQFLQPLFDAVGFAVMTDHQFLSADRQLQRSAFENGVEVVVNFSDTPRMFRKRTIASLGYEIFYADREDDSHVE